MSENINANRLALYKNHAKHNQDSLRQRRHDVTVELRKNKKDDQLFKRRNINDMDPTSPLQENNGQSPATLSIEEIVEGMWSKDPKQQFLATQSTRKILSRERNPPIDLIINHGIVPICVKFLENFDYPELQFEATWTLTNLASGTSEQTKTVVDAGGIPRLITLLNSPALNVADQAVWALGNIAGDGPPTRDLVLNHGVVDLLIQLLQREIPLSFQQNVVWLVSNLCRNKNPHPPFEKISPMLPILAQHILHHDTAVLSDVCWALSYISDEDNEKIGAIIETGILPPLVKLLEHTDPSVVTPALRTVGNIVTGTDLQTDEVIAAGALPLLKKLLGSSKSNFVKEAAWAISNIAAGNRGQIQALLNENLFSYIIQVLTDGDFRAQKEAAWVLTNISTGGSYQQIAEILNLNPLEPFCNLLECKDPRVIKVVLNGIENIFQMFEKEGDLDALCIKIESIGALDKLENLQNHENEEIYKKAYAIVDKYFSVEAVDGPVDQNGQIAFDAVNSNTNNGFSF